MKIKNKLKLVPNNISFLAPHPHFSFPPSTINLIFNKKTFNTICTTHVPKNYYDDYIMTTTFSETMQNLQSIQAEKLAKYCNNPNKMIEIGCGDGSFLNHCSKHFKKVVGIEPSFKFGEEARKKGFKIICDYVSSKKILLKEKFDAFASRQVFEHLKDPNDVLNGIKYMLKEGSVGLIEVPNGYRALRNGNFYEFFPDHIQYYSVNSLVDIATKNGFNVISCNETFNGNYLELWIRWEPNADKYFKNIIKTQSKVSNQIKKFIKNNENIAIFGAGAKTLSILSTIDCKTVNKIKCVIDDDPHKWNKYIPNTSIPIINYINAQTNFKFDNILILALSYIDEISNKVKKLFPSVKVFSLINNKIVSV